jgi:hypothetical protein
MKRPTIFVALSVLLAACALTANQAHVEPVPPDESPLSAPRDAGRE